MKITITRLMMTMLLLVMSATTWAYDVEVGGIYYNLDSEAKTAEVTYETTSYNSYSGTVTIPETIVSDGVTYSVTSIGEQAFIAMPKMYQPQVQAHFPMQTSRMPHCMYQQLQLVCIVPQTDGKTLVQYKE